MAASDDKTKSFQLGTFPKFPSKTFFAKFPEKLTDFFFLPPWFSETLFQSDVTPEETGARSRGLLLPGGVLFIFLIKLDFL